MLFCFVFCGLSDLVFAFRKRKNYPILRDDTISGTKLLLFFEILKYFLKNRLKKLFSYPKQPSCLSFLALLFCSFVFYVPLESSKPRILFHLPLLEMHHPRRAYLAYYRRRHHQHQHRKRKRAYVQHHPRTPCPCYRGVTHIV